MWSCRGSRTGTSPDVHRPASDASQELASEALFFGGLGRSADRSRWRALSDRMHAGGAHEQHHQTDRSAHEDHCRPSGQPGEHVGRGARTEGGLRTLSAKCSGKIGRAALLQQNHANQKEAHNHVHDNHEIEENLHSRLLSIGPAHVNHAGLG